LTTKYDGRTLTDSQEALAFAEIAPGIFFPARTETKSLVDGRVVRHWQTQFGKIEVNREFRNPAPELQFPPKTLVADRVNGKAYTVGEDGSVTRFGPLPDSLSSDDETPRELSGAGQARWGVWGYCGIVGILLVVGIGAWCLFGSRPKAR
jgi:hypothetical protein